MANEALHAGRIRSRPAARETSGSNPVPSSAESSELRFRKSSPVVSSEGSLGIPTRTGWGRHGVNATLADAELKDLRLESWKVLFFTETQHRSAFSSPSLNPGRASSKKPVPNH